MQYNFPKRHYTATGIDPAQLRIGNWVHTAMGYAKVMCVSQTQLRVHVHGGTSHMITPQEVSPVRLANGEMEIDKTLHKVMITSERGLPMLCITSQKDAEVRISDPLSIQVHTIQNLYFFGTNGEELNLIFSNQNQQ